MAKGDIDNNLESREFLFELKAGRIKEGLRIGCKLDDHLRYKQGTFNVILGQSNVGKTSWMFWYFLNIALKHKKRFLVFSSENTIGGIKRDLIQFYQQGLIENISYDNFTNAMDAIEHSFSFVEIDHLYTHRDLIKTFENNKDDFDGFLVDPYNSLIKSKDIAGNSHDYDYQAASEFRIFCRANKKTLYLVAHATTESLRKVYPKGHDFEGYPIPPSAADIEGGGKWVNRADDFIVIHRLTQHPERWMFTEVHVKKVKETITGGTPTFLNEPVCFRLHYGNRFYCQENHGKELEPIKNEEFFERDNLPQSTEF